MAHLLSSERPTAAATSASFFATAFAGVAGWFGKARARRNQRIALANLLEFDEHRLDDLGISRQDVVEAIRQPVAVGKKLSARRAARAAEMQSNAASTALFEAGGTY